MLTRSLRTAVAATTVLLIVAGCGSDHGHVEEVQACADRGGAYFTETGAYPTLTAPPNAERSAEEVALERCNRTTTAF